MYIHIICIDVYICLAIFVYIWAMCVYLGEIKEERKKLEEKGDAKVGLRSMWYDPSTCALLFQPTLLSFSSHYQNTHTHICIDITYIQYVCVFVHKFCFSNLVSHSYIYAASFGTKHMCGYYFYGIDGSYMLEKVMYGFFSRETKLGV